MAVNFPSSPSLNDTYTYAGRVWKWNGKAWESVSASYGPTPTFTVGTVESGVDPAVTITGTAPDLTLNMIIPDPYEIAVDNGFVGTEAEWVDATLNLVNGVRITVSETAPTSPDTNDLWFW